MATFSFFISGEPVAKAAVKVTVRGTFAHKYMPAKTRHAIDDARAQIASQLREKYPTFQLLQGPLNISVLVFRSRPKSAPKRVKFPTTRPDLDNYLKLLFDAMNSVVFLDDAQIISIHAAKGFSQEKIGIEVNIEEVET
jgi:Holliday junction resolvase RusA-like endonuclease